MKPRGWILWLALAAPVMAAIRPVADVQDPDLEALRQVADWQLAQPSALSGNNWEHGALYAGVMAAAEATRDPVYLDAARTWAEAFDWRLTRDNSRHADHHCCGQTYIELFLLDRADPRRLEHVRASNDRIVADPYHFFCNSNSSSVWSWCDALFMQPPVLARLSFALGDPAYLDLMQMMWSETQQCLFDPDESLFYRDIRYVDDRIGGRKVFWGRGNGWVLGGLVRVLQVLPFDHPDRPGYEQTFTAMATRLADLQQPDGSWHANLLVPEQFDTPETSGTGFFCYGLAWGINQGLLEETRYGPVVEAAWQALQRAVQPDGRLGWVQPPGAGPNASSADSTAVYGVGAFLLAGSEVAKWHHRQRPGWIEDFESTVRVDGTDASLDATWRDGRVNGTGARLSLAGVGDRFAVLTYQTSPAQPVARIDRVFASDQDWRTATGPILALQVQGDPNNTPLPLTLECADRHGRSVRWTAPATGITAATWQQWANDLSDHPGFDLAAIRRLSLQIGPGTGQGRLHVDRIERIDRVQRDTVDGDFDGDGRVDLADFALLAAAWHQPVGSVVTPVQPDDRTLSAYWPLDETSGAVAADAGPAGRDGLVRHIDWGPDQGLDAGAALFDAVGRPDTHIAVPTSAWSVEAGTVAFWVYLEPEQQAPSTRYLFGHTTLPAFANRLQLYFDDGDTRLDLGLGNQHRLRTAIATVPVEQWTHITLTWDQGTYRCFVDGRPRAEGSYAGLQTLQVEAHLGNNGMPPGSASLNQGLNGRLDEVRAYRRALGEAEVMALAGVGPRLVEVSPLDQMPDGVVNALDLRQWSSRWLADRTWP